MHSGWRDVGVRSRGWLPGALILLLTLVVLAALSIPLALWLAAGVLLGLGLALVPWRSRSARWVALGALALLIVGGGLLVIRPWRAPIEHGGPFTTAYRQETRLGSDRLDVAERYVVDADPGVTIERIQLEGAGEVRPVSGGRVEGMAVIPSEPTVAFDVVRASLPVDRTTTGYRAWQTTVPLLRATVTFRQAGDTAPRTWPIVRCRDLSMLMRLQLDDGRLVATTPQADRLSGGTAEWRSVGVFDPTDFNPEVTLHVDQSPGLLRFVRSSGQFALTTIRDQVAALSVGAAATWLAVRVRRQWKRTRQPAQAT